MWIAPGMIRSASKQLQQKLPDKCSQVTFICKDAFDHQSETPYDLIITQFFLDCFKAENLEKLMSHLDQQLSLQGQWLLADFSSKSRLGRLVSAALYPFFYYFCGIDTKKLNNFKYYFNSLYYSDQDQIRVRGMIDCMIFQKFNLASHSDSI